jgi:hypothetical protein
MIELLRIHAIVRAARALLGLGPHGLGPHVRLADTGVQQQGRHVGC